MNTKNTRRTPFDPRAIRTVLAEYEEVRDKQDELMSTPLTTTNVYDIEDECQALELRELDMGRMMAAQLASLLDGAIGDLCRARRHVNAAIARIERAEDGADTHPLRRHGSVDEVVEDFDDEIRDVLSALIRPDVIAASDAEVEPMPRHLIEQQYPQHASALSALVDDAWEAGIVITEFDVNEAVGLGGESTLEVDGIDVNRWREWQHL